MQYGINIVENIVFSNSKGINPLVNPLVIMIYKLFQSPIGDVVYTVALFVITKKGKASCIPVIM